MLVGLIIAFIIWMASIATAIIVGKAKYKPGRIISPTNILFVGTFLSAISIFVPIYYNNFINDDVFIREGKTFLLSVHHAIRLFLVDSDFDIISSSIMGLNEPLSTCFSTFAAIIFVTAPILTFDFLLSFFKNVSSYRRYIRGFFKDVFIFSELNDKSLSLAKSIVSKNKKNIIIFTDVFEKNEEKSYELIEQAKELGAICFKKDIVSINFKFHSKRKALSFFAIGEDEIENVNQSVSLIKKYNDRANTMLYMFSTSVDSELIMTSSDKGKVKVRRIKDVRSLIYRTLYEMEDTVIEQRKQNVQVLQKDLFMSAKDTDDGVKQIGAVVVGCGLHGIEMVKALTWFCQMDGYRVSIDVFDKDKDKCSKFSAMCPELMDKKYNGVYVDGEAQYFIDFHSYTNKATGERFGIDVNTIEFVNEIKKLVNTTYVFVALGSDEENIKVAVALRTIFEQMKIHPTIQAIVYNSKKKEALNGITNFKHQGYDIDFVGDLDTLYSYDVIIDSELEDDALDRHLNYVKDITDEKIKREAEEDFWKYEYNYRSSTASALHVKARIACGIPGAGKQNEELTENERNIIESLEHRRWNAYMRSEGYVYSGSTDKSSRNDLGKMHHDLVNFDKLSDEEKRKDSRVGSAHKAN